MSGRIFISYRRGDDPGNTGRLLEHLEEAFSRDQLFMGVDNIVPGQDFVRVLAQAAQCDVLLAVIGKSWLHARDNRGFRCLDKGDDFVRLQIAVALKQGKLVIPVLFQDAWMPTADELPEAIRPLARRNAVRLAHQRFRADVQGLIEAIAQALDEASAVRSAKDEKARRAAVVEPSREQIARADELDNWRAIKASANPREFRNHLARFPGGVTELYARGRLEDLVWAGLGAAPTLDQLADFLVEFPQGVHAKAATERQAVLTEALEAEQRRREAQAWVTARTAGSGEALEAFLNKWPQGQYAGEARSKLIQISDAAGLKAFLKTSPTGRHSDAARARIQELSRRWSQDFRKRVGDATATGIMVLIVALTVVGIPTSIWLFGPTLPAEHLIGTLNGHSDEVRSVAFSRDGRTAVSGSKDKVLKLWNVVTGQELRTFTGHSGGVMSVAFSPDGLTALSSSGDDTIKLWEVATGSELRTFKGHSSYGSSVAFSPDGRAVLSGGSDGSVRMREVGTGKDIVMVRDAGTVGSVAFSPDGRTALFGSLNKIKLWSVANRRELRSFEGHSEGVNSVAFSPDGLTALSGSNDKTLKLWEVATGKELRSFSMHSSHVTSAAFAPDGRTALSGSEDKTLKLWDVATGRELHTLRGHSAGVLSVAFSPDGRSALSASTDKTLKRWDLTEAVKR